MLRAIILASWRYLRMRLFSAMLRHTPDSVDYVSATPYGFDFLIRVIFFVSMPCRMMLLLPFSPFPIIDCYDITLRQRLKAFSYDISPFSLRAADAPYDERAQRALAALRRCAMQARSAL